MGSREPKLQEARGLALEELGSPSEIFIEHIVMTLERSFDEFERIVKQQPTAEEVPRVLADLNERMRQNGILKGEVRHPDFGILADAKRPGGHDSAHRVWLNILGHKFDQFVKRKPYSL